MTKKTGKDRDKGATPMDRAVAKVAQRQEALTEKMAALDQAQRAVLRAHAELQEADAERMKLAIAEMQAATTGLNS